ncbi:putative siroheme synthase [Aspergillus lucknowensis]|uniref:precorrin-2 dehydrogenase n=1 Tax=Aspergillus lucknowensis TaxID=176173 RepID=A0ABR4LVE0_9EURO
MRDALSEHATQIPLLTAVNADSQVHLIVGADPLAAARCAKSVEAGAKPTIIAPDTESLQYTLAAYIEKGSAQWIRREFRDDDLTSLGREEVDYIVDMVFITLGGNHPLSSHISKLCRRLRIPVNVSDTPELCTFSLLSTYSDGPLHIGITTSGRGCKLASRLKREISSILPPHLGSAIDRLGTVRKRLWEEDFGAGLCDANFDVDEDDSTGQKHTFNNLVTEDDVNAAKTRRIRWLSQICEYWPLQKLAAITDLDIDSILQAYSSKKAETDINKIQVFEKKGRIILAGSGPGHPDLLTRATYKAIQSADIILADKLVPAPVLELIPRRTEVHIARKFPGNADQAQEEFLCMGLDALQKGRRVLRLKQGDPYLYGRGGEEFEYFRAEGYTPVVLPGITSALSAPVFAEIPATHRGVSDQVLVCTGTGRKGAAPEPPTYVPTQTVVFLMVLHRISTLVENLTVNAAEGCDESSRMRTLWPKETPCAIIERASCSDQRVIRSTLEHICQAFESEGSRPPGLLVVGASCHVLHKPNDRRWIVEDGFRGLDEIQSTAEIPEMNGTG